MKQQCEAETKRTNVQTFSSLLCNFLRTFACLSIAFPCMRTFISFTLIYRFFFFVFARLLDNILRNLLPEKIVPPKKEASGCGERARVDQKKPGFFLRLQVIDLL
jgi:hypothetical protein